MLESSKDLFMYDVIPDQLNKPKYEIKKMVDGFVSLQIFTANNIPAQVKDKIQLSRIINLNIDFSEIQVLNKEFFDGMINVKVLSAVGNSFHTFNVTNLINLERLNLDYNVFSQVPDSILALRKLKTITLRHNFITHLPTGFGHLTELEDVSFYSNQLEQLPSSFSNLTKLINLDLSYNRLYYLPENFGNLVSLQMLRLCNNYLTELPDSFENLPNLLTLDVSDNDLLTLPKQFKSCSTLRKFCGDENDLTSIPPWLDDCTELVDVAFKNNLLKSQISEHFGIKNVKLSNVDFSGNSLNTFIPESLVGVKSLKVLDFGTCFAKKVRPQTNCVRLPDSFGKSLKYLTTLRLDECQINELPNHFGEDLKCLESINFNKNNLTTLPNTFCKLKNLALCVLSSNKLQTLPSCFGHLTNLLELRLEYNQLFILPPTFYRLVKLRTLDLWGNNMKLFPDSLRFLTDLECLGLEMDLSTLAIDFLEIKPAIARITKAMSTGAKRWKRPPLIFNQPKPSVNSRYIWNMVKPYRHLVSHKPQSSLPEQEKEVEEEDSWNINEDDYIIFEDTSNDNSFESQSFMYIPPAPRHVPVSWELMPHLPNRFYPQQLYLKKNDEAVIEGQFEDNL